MNRFAPFVAVKVRLNALGVDSLLLCQERIHNRLRIRTVIGGHGDLHPVAGGKNHRFADAFAGLQILQRGRQRLFAKGKAFSHRNGCRLVTHAGDQQLHFINMLPSRACAAQVSAEKPSTATVMMAALRPRHPALVRKKTNNI